MLTRFDKGCPDGVDAIPFSEISARKWNILREDIALPVAIIRERTLSRNSKWMARFVEANGAALAPHGKTTMAPALFDRQIADGAWGITLATPHQVQVAIALGYKRIVYANQLVGRAAIRAFLRAIEADPELELSCVVDSEANIAQIEAVARERGQSRPLGVYVEKGHAQGRTGCRTVAEALSLARAVAASPHLDLLGIEGFEALIRKEDLDTTYAAITAFLQEVVEVAEACDAEGLFARDHVVLSAGGSAFFDLVVGTLNRAKLSKPHVVLLRSGCYLTHDSGMYTYAYTLLRDRAPELFVDYNPEPALEVWAYVQSLPEPGLALVAVGKRDLSYDQMPVAEKWFRPNGSMSAPAAMPSGYRMVRLDDQHGYLEIPATSQLAVGDVIGFGISHPCLTFDKWRVLHMVDDAYDVVGSIRTYF